ncbi:alpha-1,2-fucosyltransferase [Methylotenera sp.]|uniref:alpha-1,2-fucosyltransferase n=1 Tax=Methylotenera sp. TaxID=2051956 RepID=UPI0027306650|nr:alpha-1,2-fucosyltransferase [Methylotenera sp.]MDP2231500.1 alpha-1,2-fucosyltransferase [Methylotenera sp.]
MFILSKKYGRLCNRLFNSAHVLASAIEHKHKFVNLAFYDYACFFHSTSQDIFCRFPIQSSFIQNHSKVGKLLYYVAYIPSILLRYLKNIGIKFNTLKIVSASEYQDGCNLDEILPNVISNSNQVVFFQGFPILAFNSLEKHGDEVRKYFTPSAKYQNNIRTLIADLRKDSDLLIGVVIRHGDYREYLSGRYFYTLDQYSQFMDQLHKIFSDKKLKFLICSDEEQNLSAFENFDFYFRSGHMIENLYSLAECDYIISPPSTYGMWASFFGKVPLYIINDSEKSISIDCFEICKG